jgi:class 3 adenylate cyclase
LTRGFLFSDLRGYTAFVEAHGAVAAASLLERYRQLVRAAVAEYSGAEIKTEGDSFYVVFASVSNAVRCGLAIVAAAAKATEEDSARPIRVGVGVHAGETVETSEGYVGTAVNMASRLCSAARAGEVLVSETVRTLTANASAVHYVGAGRRRLKGINGSVIVYSAVAQRPAAPRRHRSFPAAPLAAGVGVALVIAAFVLWLPGILRGTTPPAGGSTAGSASASAGGSPLVLEVPSDNPEGPAPSPYVLAPQTRYQTANFRPRISFVPPDGTWRATIDDADALELDRWATPDAFQGYISAAAIQVVLAKPCIDSETQLLDSTPQALIVWLQANRELRTTAPRPINLGGLAGLSVEIRQRPDAPGCQERDLPENLASRVFLFPVGESSFSVDRDERVRVIVLDFGGARPMTLLVGTRDPAQFGDFSDAAQALIETIEIPQ